jgi:uncharacterized membrane protein HdeD (DUF308 family)
MARLPPMTISPAGEAREKSWWVYTFLGVVLLFAGAFVLADLVVASAFSAIWIASAIIVAGGLLNTAGAGRRVGNWRLRPFTPRKLQYWRRHLPSAAG